MITQAGGTVRRRRRQVPLRRPDLGLKALQRFRRFVTEGGMPLIDWDQSRQQFIAGKIGIFFDTPARLRQVTDLIGDKFTLRTAIFPIDDKAKGGLPTGGNAAIITTRDPTEAEGRVGVPEVRHRTGSAEDRRRDDRATCRRTCVRPDRSSSARSTTRTRTSAPSRCRWTARCRGRAIRAATRCASGARSARSSPASCAARSRRRPASTGWSRKPTPS